MRTSKERARLSEIDRRATIDYDNVVVAELASGKDIKDDVAITNERLRSEG